MIRLLIVLLCCAGPAVAKPVRVTSGEHEGFTRVVLAFPNAADWQMGRTTDGYELRVAGARPVYDLSAAFDLIARDRLAALFADPESGSLQFRVDCRCHALPFALRPDTVVIDLKDGPAPEGWSFEMALDGRAMAPLKERQVAQQPVLGPVAPWDWTDMALGGRWGGASVPPDAVPFAAPGKGEADAALQAALVEGLFRAATQGLVDPVKKLPKPVAGVTAVPDSVQIGISAGLDARPASSAAPDLSAEGLQCPGEERLAVQDWGDDRPIREQMADATASLSGEFDRTQPEALFRAVRFQLFLGFGAEARALMRAFGGVQPDGALWTSLSFLVDGQHDPEGPLQGLAGCDDPAALWATLADPALSLTDVNAKALLRSFSALPAHLRLQLGPALVERFTASGDLVTAQGLSDAILRLPVSDDDRRAVLMRARIALDAQDAEAADRLLARLMADPGPLVADVMASQIDLAAMTGAPVTQASVTSIEAMLREADDAAAPALHRALALAQALSGDWAAAFGDESIDPSTRTDLWRLLAERGPDETVLAEGLALDEDLPRSLGIAVRRKVGERLLVLGFPEAAQIWVGTDDPLLAARAALSLGKPDEVMGLLGLADGEAARRLKAEALLQLDAAAAARAYADLGEEDQSQRAARLAKAWPEISDNGEDP